MVGDDSVMEFSADPEARLSGGATARTPRTFIDELGQKPVDAGVQLPVIPDFPEALHRIADDRVWRTVQNKGKT